MAATMNHVYAGSPNPLKKWNPKGLGYPPAFHLFAAEVPGGVRAVHLHISGLTGTTRDDGSSVASAAEQCEVAYQKVSAALAAAGMSWADVVHRTTWMTEECSLSDVRLAEAAAMGGAMMTASAVVIDALSDGCFVEVEVFAAKADADVEADEPVRRFGLPGTPPPTPPGLWGCTTVQSSALLFVSGQVGDTTPAEQPEAVYAQLSSTLADAGYTWGDAVKRRTFRTPGWDRSADIEAGRLAMDGAMSAHTGVGVTRLAAPEFLVETELVAARTVLTESDGGAAAAAGSVRRWGRTGWGSAEAVEVPPGARLLFTAGVVGKLSDGITLAPTAAEQCAHVFENLGVILADAGLNWGDCVKMVMYFTSDCDLAVLRDARAVALGKDLACAATGIGVREIPETPGAVVAIDIIAAAVDREGASGGAASL
jgi:enamine deaminase RidA (YjgF/YER057c/UK114 family)